MFYPFVKYNILPNIQIFSNVPLNRKRSASEEPDGDRRQWRPPHPLRLCRSHRINLSHSNALTFCFTPLTTTTTTTNPFSLSIRIWGARSKASRVIAAGHLTVSPTWTKTPPLSPIPAPTLLLRWFLSLLSPLLPNTPPKMPKRLSFSSAPRPRPSPRKSPPTLTPSSFAPSLGGSSLLPHAAFLTMHDASAAPLFSLVLILTNVVICVSFSSNLSVPFGWIALLCWNWCHGGAI